MTPYLTHLTIGGRRIGPGEPTYIIAEVGINHNGNPEVARRLVDVAVGAQVDAVKFQKRHLSALYSAETLLDPTLEEKEVGFLLPFLQEAELSEEALADLADYSRARGVEFLCTPWDAESLGFLESLDMQAYKVSSPDLTNLPLLEALCAASKPLIVSTGMSKPAEIAATVDFLKSRGAQFALLHCRSTYPAPFKDVNLRFMEKLREFGVPVGYSGHERGIAVSTVAAALGACIIERHVTLDRTMPGPDHAASLEPQGIEKQVRDIRNVEEAMGAAERGLSRGELLNRLALGKSLVAARDIAPGEVISADMVRSLGPGHGISPQRIGELVGRTARRRIAAQQQFRESDLTDATLEELAASFPLRWGPVVRYRDIAAMARFEPDLFEFHLTDTDLDAPIPALPARPQEVVVHAPEYYHGRLLDFASAEREVVARSVEVMRRVMDVARALRESFPSGPERVRIVVHPGGMTYEPRPEAREEMVAQACRVLQGLAGEPDVQILVENMPPYPWYFGGQWHHNAFMAAADMLRLVEQTGVGLCLDLSHAALACATGQCADDDRLESLSHGLSPRPPLPPGEGGDSKGASPPGPLSLRERGRTASGNDGLREFIEALASHISHVHIADASGTDGEGLQIGEGEVNFGAIMPLIALTSASIVPEIWLGHRNDGEGFIVALDRLRRWV